MIRCVATGIDGVCSKIVNVDRDLGTGNENLELVGVEHADPVEGDDVVEASLELGTLVSNLKIRNV